MSSTFLLTDHESNVNKIRNYKVENVNEVTCLMFFFVGKQGTKAF